MEKFYQITNPSGSSISSCSLPENHYVNNYNRDNSYVSLKNNGAEFSLFPNKSSVSLNNNYLNL